MAQQTRIPCLDGLRALSIGLVISGHASFAYNTTELGRLFKKFFGNQELGVSIFFVISGYLITWLLLEEQKREGTISLKAFYVRRAFRIWPAFYFFLAVMALLGALGSITLHSRDLYSAMLFVWNYHPATSDWWVGHSWSLSVEEQFYLLWPAAVLLLNRRSVFRLAAAIILFSPLIRLCWYFLFPEWRGRMSIMLHTRADTLMFGAVLALLQGEGWFEEKFRKLGGPALAIAAALFIFIVSPVLKEHFRGSYLMTAGYSLEGLFIAYLIYWLVRNSHGWIGIMLNSRPFVHVGNLSFSLYLWQQFFLTEKSPVLAGVFPWSLVFTYLAAELSYRLVERPFLRMKKRWENLHARHKDNAAISGHLTAPSSPAQGQDPRA